MMSVVVSHSVWFVWWTRVNSPEVEVYLIPRTRRAQTTVTGQPCSFSQPLPPGPATAKCMLDLRKRLIWKSVLSHSIPWCKTSETKTHVFILLGDPLRKNNVMIFWGHSQDCPLLFINLNILVSVTIIIIVKIMIIIWLRLLLLLLLIIISIVKWFDLLNMHK